MRHRLAFVALLLALSSMGAGQTEGVVETRLDNGLTVLMKEAHAAPVFTAQVWFKVGSRNEHTGITGISHLLEHMLFKSSKHYREGEISRLINERGGIENAATWTDFTYYWQLLAPEHLEFSLKTLAERVGSALLTEKEFAKERTVVLSELDGRENEPGFLLYRDLMATAFMAHPYQWPTIGWRSDVQNINRSQLWSYYTTYYHPNNATLVLVGDFDSKKALALVKKYFIARPVPGSAGPVGISKPARAGRPVYTTEPIQRGERRVIVRRAANAARVTLAYHIPGIDNPDTYPLMVLDQILSGGRASRLYQALVEKQLATSAWSSADIRKDPSVFMLGATARQGCPIEQLEKALLEQVEAAKSAVPTQDELTAAKNQLEAYVIFQNDSVSDQGEQLGYYNTVSTWRYLTTLIPQIKAVTADQVLAVAKKYLVTDNLTTGALILTNSTGAGGPEGALAGAPLRRQKWMGVCEKSPTAPPAAGSPRNQQIKPCRITLDNGLVLIVQENHSNPTVAVSCRLLAGSCFDPNGKRGTASLTAEMLQRGTQKRSALEIARQIESVGASLNARADVESADVGGRALSRDLGLLLDVLSDQLRNASFPQDQFEKAKGEALSALEQSKESTDAQAFRAFYNAVFPEGHPLHEPTFEQAKSEMESITRDDVAAFHKAYYRPDTTILVIVGDVTPDQAAKLARHYFGGWQAEGPKPVVDIPTVPPQTEPKKITVPVPDKSEATEIFGYALGLRRKDPDYYAVRIMNQILGGSGALTSLLGGEVREKRGLVYDIHSTFDAGLGAGPWYAALGTNPKDVDKAIESMKRVIEQFKKNGPTRQQFERARDFTIGIFAIALETNAGIARALTSAEFYGLGLDYLRKYPGIYRSVTLDQVKAAAKKYLRPEAATLVIAGPTAPTP